MQQRKENINSAEFTSQIENAIDNLFSAKRDIVIDPSTNEVIEQEGGAHKQSLTGKKDPGKSLGVTHPAPGKMDKKRLEEDPTILLEKLNQSFLTIDWEVSEKNVNTFKELLTQLRKVLSFSQDTDEGRVIGLMDDVLTSMVKSPSSVPASAVQALQKGLVYIQEVIDRTPEAKKEVAELCSATVAALTNSLSRKALDETTPLPPIGEDELDLGDLEQALAEEGLIGEILDSGILPPLAKQRLAAEVSGTINLHLTLLAQVINNILPLEEQFSRSPLLRKLLDIHQEIRIQLEEQKDILSTALTTDYSNVPPLPDTQVPETLGQILTDHIQILVHCGRRMAALEKVFKQTKGYEKLSAVATQLHSQFEDFVKTFSRLLHSAQPEFKTPAGKEEVPGELVEAFRSHVLMLDKAIKQALSMENLFEGRSGYEKLYSAQQRMRRQLEGQKDFLATALTGDYLTLPSGLPGEGGKDAGPKVCPWKNLLLGQWLGKNTAFVPEQIAMQHAAPGWTTKIYRQGMTEIHLSRFKKWPWSKIGHLFTGDLAKLDEKELAGKRLPLLAPLHEYFAPPGITGKEVMLILYKDGRGGIILLDGQPVTLETGKDQQWEPAIKLHTSFLAGYIKTAFDVIPVLDLTRG